MPRLLKGRGGGGGELAQLKAKHVGPTIVPKRSSAAISAFLSQQLESGDFSDDGMSVSSVASSLGSLELKDSKADSKAAASKLRMDNGDRKRSRAVVPEDVPSSGGVHPPRRNGELLQETVARHTREDATSDGGATEYSPSVGGVGVTEEGNTKTNTDGRWLCNMCGIVSFDSMEEAFCHEKMCLAVQRNLHQRALEAGHSAAQVERSQQQALLSRQPYCAPLPSGGMLGQLARQEQQLMEARRLQGNFQQLLEANLDGVHAAALNAASRGVSAPAADPFSVAELRRQQQIHQNAVMAGFTPSAVPGLSRPAIGAARLQPAPTLAPSINAFPPQANVAPSYLLQQRPLPSTAYASTMEALLSSRVGSAGPPLPVFCTATAGIAPPGMLQAATTVAASPQLPRPSEKPPPPLHMPNRLALPEDVNYLNERECFLRAECLALFKATKQDSMNTRNGRKKPIWVGQVGMRCVFCMKVRATEKVPANTFEQTLGKGKQGRAHREACYPSSLKFIRKALDNWRENHFGSCPNIPEEVKEKYAGLARQGSCNAEQYRVEAALKVGLVDCPGGGVRFIRDQAP